MSSPRLGVAVLLKDQEGKLLLGLRGKEPNYGKWIIPGGGIKFGESIIDAAKREIKEETNLDIEIISIEKPHVLEIINDNEHRVIFFYEGKIIGGDLKASSDLLDAKFFSKEDLPVENISDVCLKVLRGFRY